MCGCVRARALLYIHTVYMMHLYLLLNLRKQEQVMYAERLDIES